jgi:hypothetical protein
MKKTAFIIVFLIPLLLISCITIKYSLSSDEINTLWDLVNLLKDHDFETARRDGHYNIIVGPRMFGNIMHLHYNGNTHDIIIPEKILKSKYLKKIYYIRKNGNATFFVYTLTMDAHESGIIYSPDGIIDMAIETTYNRKIKILQKIEDVWIEDANNIFHRIENFYYYKTWI